ncbi:hypothetical protein EDD18DRAFT_1362080 [Armillaria luteobubalina]|uniref:PGAP2IP first transmembrane domain-containing protein n=1 Tax=Armillaria luteobubalina TaxID=153913 RepID=A0AA39PF55_9AGAR|nr:hypothetical protein EDD18DRAFT_1362080 [Armillaria luteobubalina]
MLVRLCLRLRASTLQANIFSILHPPLNVPVLSISLNKDYIDTNNLPSRNGTVPVKESETASVSTLAPKRGPSSFRLLTVFQNPVVSFISDVYLSYIFWSIFKSLTPTLFYFSVWELGIAGHEPALLSVLSPLLLSVDPPLRWARTQPAQIFLHFLSLSGLVASLLQKPLQRLFVVAFAASMAVLRQTADWATRDEYAMGYQSITTGLGLLLSSLLKHANHSNNPVWPFLNEQSGGHNKTGIALALLCIIELLLRPTFEQRTTAHPPTEPPNNWFSGATHPVSDSISSKNLKAVGIFSMRRPVERQLNDNFTRVASHASGKYVHPNLNLVHCSNSALTQVSPN